MGEEFTIWWTGLHSHRSSHLHFDFIDGTQQLSNPSRRQSFQDVEVLNVLL